MTILYLASDGGRLQAEALVEEINIAPATVILGSLKNLIRLYRLLHDLADCIGERRRLLRCNRQAEAIAG